jgi:flavin reductase (DIM6/NTAB) family NADH-FMN oxidoreductase RutF/rubredoxin
MDKTALFTLTYGLYILTANCQGKQNGCIVNTVCQVTSDPVQLAVTVSKNNLTEEMIDQCGFFTVTPLSQDASLELIGNFGFKSGRDFDKFAMLLSTTIDMNNIKYVTEFTTAVFSCRLVNKLDVGTHILFIGEVQSAEKLSSAPAMTYEYYHQVKKGLTPRNAPSYQSPVEKDSGDASEVAPIQASSMPKRWRCSVCGYIYEGESFPVDYKCPICGQPASVFEEI